MITEGLVEKVTELAVPVAEGMGLDIVDVEYTFDHGRRVLRVYIDKPGGVTIDDCVDFSREFSTVLDIEDPIHERYSLEVSSPGLDRPLVKESDFVRFAGKKARIKTKRPIDGRKNFKATIEGVEEGAVIVVDSECRKWSIPLSEIDRARLEVEL